MRARGCSAFFHGPRLRALPARASTRPLPRAQDPLERTARGDHPARVLLPNDPVSRTSCVSTVFSDSAREPGTPLTPASCGFPIPPASSCPSSVLKDYTFHSPTSSRSCADSATLVGTEEGEEDWTLALDLALSAGMLIGAPRSVALPALPPRFRLWVNPAFACVGEHECGWAAQPGGALPHYGWI